MHDQSIKVKKQIISILVLILLIAITFFFYLRNYSFHELWNGLKNANYAYLGAGFGMMVLFVLCEAINISLILKALGSPRPFIRCIEYSNLGFYFSSITPSASGGQPAQIYYMKQDNIPVALSSITIFFIVYVYQIVMILFGIIMSFLQYAAAVDFIHKLNYLFLFGVIVNTLVIFLLFTFMFSNKAVPFITRLIIKAGERLRIIKNGDQLKSKFDQMLTSFHEKSLILKTHTRLFIKILLITLIQMVSLNSIPSLVYLSMGYPLTDFAKLFTCQSLLTISVSAIPLPGAEGVTQGGFLQVFDAYFPKEMLTYAMLINRFISFYLPLLLSLMIYILTYYRTTKQSVRGDDFDQ